MSITFINRLTIIRKKKPSKHLQYDTRVFVLIEKTHEKLRERLKEHKWFQKVSDELNSGGLYSLILRKYFNLDHIWMKYNSSDRFDLVDGDASDRVVTKDKKYHSLLSTPEDLGSREDDRLKINRNALAQCMQSLKEGGSLLLSFVNFRLKETWDLFYDVLRYFEDAVVIGVDKVLFQKFHPDAPSPAKLYYDVDDLNEHFTYCAKRMKNRYYKFLLENDMDAYCDYLVKHLYRFVFRISDYDTMLQIQTKMIDIFKRVKVGDNDIKRISSNVNSTEGNYLSALVEAKGLKKVLEVGFAFGISTMYLCRAVLKTGGSVTSIDPFQSSQWHNYGLKLITYNKLSNVHTLIEEKSYVALPRLITREPEYDMIFIDGWHTFDYTLVDFFFADKLIKIGGYIVIDDIRHHSVKQVVNYLVQNYTFYRRVSSPSTLLCMQKIKEDTRDWNHHVQFT